MTGRAHNSDVPTAIARTTVDEPAKHDFDVSAVDTDLNAESPKVHLIDFACTVATCSYVDRQQHRPPAAPTASCTPPPPILRHMESIVSTGVTRAQRKLAFLYDTSNTALGGESCSDQSAIWCAHLELPTENV